MNGHAVAGQRQLYKKVYYFMEPLYDEKENGSQTRKCVNSLKYECYHNDKQLQVYLFN